MANDERLRKFVLATCRNYIRQESDGWAVDPNGLVWYEAYAGGFKSSDEAIDELLNLYFEHDRYEQYAEKKRSEEEASRLRLEAEVKLLEAEILELKAQLTQNKS